MNIIPCASQKILAIGFPTERCVFERFGRLPPAWAPVCNNGSMFHQLARIDAKITFDYAETTLKHASNH